MNIKEIVLSVLVVLFFFALFAIAGTGDYKVMMAEQEYAERNGF